MKLLPADLALVGDAARAVEKVSAAEVVVVIQRQSGSYRDVDLLVGISLALLSLIVILFVEMEFPAWVVPFNVAASFALGTGLADWLNLARFLTRRQRQVAQVKEAAHAVFSRRGIANTRGRTGVLIYWSLFERRLEALFDQGTAAALPKTQKSQWCSTLHKIDQLPKPAAALAEHLNNLASLLKDTLPVQADDENELSDEVIFGDSAQDPVKGATP